MKKFIVLITFILLGCNSNIIQPVVDNPIQTIDSVHFLTSSYIELSKIKQVSKFRSGIGHNYSDDFENCLSMKHYFYPKDSINWSEIAIYSPVNGRVVRLDSEWAGVQIHIQPLNFSKYNIIIFHLNFTRSIKLGDSIKSGEQIGKHIGNQTYSDIAISSTENNKYKLLSYFDVISDSLFQKFKQNNTSKRNDFIISKELRISDPLNCINDSFSSEGKIGNWFYFEK
ncbi:MAG: hypothetical protein NTW25_11540 [Candidatus Kapabacteria bacterium]|nr:hypothetical protein [Candidatus Kapabacteria bacterium]